jgi:MFS family permease
MANEIREKLVHYSWILVYMTTRSRQHDFVLDEIFDIFFLRMNKDPLQALRYPEFRYFVISSFLITVAQLVQEVVIGYELYRITHDPLAIGMIGLVEAVPFIGLSLFGGHLADRVSKKKIILVSIAGIMVNSLFLHFYTTESMRAELSSFALLAGIYSAIFLIGVLRAFYSPAAQSLRAFLIPREAYENASTWGSSAWQSGAIVGPMIAGFSYLLFGFSNTLLIVVGLVCGTFILQSLINDKPVSASPKHESIVDSLKEGIRFVYKTKIILYSISLDLFSVLFGGVVAILPIFAEDILHVGAEGLGLLRSAPSIGAVITLLLLSRHSPMKHAWRNLLIVIAAFGICILVFAFSTVMWLSLAALFFSGAFDSVSVVIRGTILQLMTPDELRGRVQSVNGMFLSSSNELGGFESGLAAKLFGTIPSVIFGGTMTLVIVAWVYTRSKELFTIKLKS